MPCLPTPPYYCTVSMTPPPSSTPSPSKPTTTAITTTYGSESPTPVFDSPEKVVYAPPPQPCPIDNSIYVHQVSDGSVLGFFENAVNRLQNGVDVLHYQYI